MLNSLLLNLKDREAEKSKKEKSLRQQESKQKVKVLEKELKKACNKRDGAITLLKKLKQKHSPHTERRHNQLRFYFFPSIGITLLTSHLSNEAFFILCCSDVKKHTVALAY
jgi:hypothetical protein